MDTIVIGFSYHKNNILSKTICLIEHTPYSHVYVRRQSKYGEYIYQASGLQVNFMNIHTFLDTNIVVKEFTFEITDEIKDKIMTEFISIVGKPYSLKQLLLIGVGMILPFTKPNISTILKNDPDFICSKVAAIVFDIIETDLEIADYNTLSPKDIYQIISDYVDNQ